MGNTGTTAKNPCYVLAPQAPATEVLTHYWALEPDYSRLLNLLKEIINNSNYAIDTHRIYVIGMSNGGTGTWNMIEKNPDLFAAAVPICGVTDHSAIADIIDLSKGAIVSPVNSSYVNIIKNIPVWVVHGADDPAVSYRNSKEMVEAVQSAGGNLIRYTEYPAGTLKPMGHFSWVPALQNQELIDWLFQQEK